MATPPRVRVAGRACVLAAALALALPACGQQADSGATLSPTPVTPADSDAPTARPTPSPGASSPAPTGSPVDVDVEASVTVTEGGVTGGAPRIEAATDDVVRLRVTSDTRDEIHVHGYDLEAPVGPDEPAELTFQADLPGVYDVELHDRGLLIAELEVGA